MTHTLPTQSDDGEAPYWQDYLHWCSDNELIPHLHGYILWLDEQGYTDDE